MNNQMVFLTNEMVATSSRVVAEYFGMEHRTVLRALDNKMGSAQNCVLLQNMFFEATYTTAQNKQVREVIMNRDGFSLLAMGFTGAKALEFQLKFIQEFNRMEAELKANKTPQTYAQALLEAGRLALELEQKEALLLEQKPKVTYHDTILQSDGLVTITEIAKDYGLSAVALNRILSEHRIQYKVNGTWTLYAEHVSKGLVKSKTVLYEDSRGKEKSKMHTQWTQKGRLMIHDLLMNLGYRAFVDKELA